MSKTLEYFDFLHPLPPVSEHFATKVTLLFVQPRGLAVTVQLGGVVSKGGGNGETHEYVTPVMSHFPTILSIKGLPGVTTVVVSFLQAPMANMAKNAMIQSCCVFILFHVMSCFSETNNPI